MAKEKIRISLVGKVPSSFGIANAMLKEAARFFARKSSLRVNATWHEVVVHLVDDETSDAAHRAIMNIEGATDVITQAYDAIPPEAPGLFGELIVNLDRAKSAAPKRKGWSVAKELLLYVAHGMDHLSGADDFEPADYARMRRRELGWIRALKC